MADDKKNKCPRCGCTRWKEIVSGEELSAECEECGFKFETTPPPSESSDGD